MTTTTVQKNDIPMFLAKLWNLVEDPQTNALIHWDSIGHSFIVHDPGTFAKVLLPQYFKHRNMASFIRVLNMYGFRKVIKLDSGSLQSIKDEMEFQHPCFVRGNEQLLIHIKRKLSSAPATQLQKNLTRINVIPIENQNSDPEAGKILEEIQSLRAKQESMQAQFEELKRENETVWAELLDVRSKHAHQQIVVNKLIEFFITLLHSTGNVTSSVLRAPPPQLAIQNATVANEPGPAKRARLEKDGTSSQGDYQGPIIRDVTDEWSNYSQQDPQQVDWDRLLSLDEDLSQLSGNNLASTASPLEGSKTQGIIRAPLRDSQNPPVLSGSNSCVPASNTSQALSPSLPLLDLLLNTLRTHLSATSHPNFVGLSGNAAVQQLFGPTIITAPASPIIIPPPSPAVNLPVAQQIDPPERNNQQTLYSKNVDVANALIAVYGSQSNNQNGEALDSAHMEQQVNTMQTSLDSIRNILQNPQFNLDFSQILHLFPSTENTPVVADSQTVPSNEQVVSGGHRPFPSNAPDVHLNQLMGYNPHILNLEDNFMLEVDEGDDFLKAFASLPNDDIIEGVTIQIPEYVSNTNDLASLCIPLPTSTSPADTASGSMVAKRKRKAANPSKA